MSQPSILTLRRRWCLEMAEQLEGHFEIEHMRMSSWDRDKAAKLIESFLPDTWDEALAYADEMDRQIDVVTITVNPPPGLTTQLRDALGFHQGAPLRKVLEAAIECAKAAKNGEVKP